GGTSARSPYPGAAGTATESAASGGRGATSAGRGAGAGDAARPVAGSPRLEAGLCCAAASPGSARRTARSAAPLTIDAIDDECNEALLLCTSARSLRRPLAASNREQSGVTVADEPGGAKRRRAEAAVT